MPSKHKKYDPDRDRSNSAAVTIFEVGHRGRALGHYATIGLAMKAIHGRGPGYRVWKIVNRLGFGRHGEQAKVVTLVWPREETA